MKLAIISDTHLPKGTRAIPAACLRRLRDADAILHAGDFVAAEVLRALEALGPSVHAVRGNVDTPELRSELPETVELDLDGVQVAMTHDAGQASGRLKRLRRRFPSARAVIFGHSHLPLLEAAGEGFQIFNPGSPTERRRAPSHTMGIATVQDGRIAFELVALD